MPAIRINAEGLLRGAYYAMEQAGNLLHDAVTLHREGRNASAAVLAVFSQEEVGRAYIYLNQRAKLLSTAGSISAKKLNTICQDHLYKLTKGQLSVEFSLPPGATIKEIEVTAAQLMKRKPREALMKRPRFLYVDFDESAKGWNRPCNMSRADCTSFLRGTANNYSIAGRKFLTTFQPALKQWTDFSPLPGVGWPR